MCPSGLLNNQESACAVCAHGGLEVFKWHGDVSESRRQRFREAPGHILMTTPESLEVMMISARTDARALFQGLSALVIDEVHAFAADDRGAHLVSLLERLVALTGRDINASASATVGTPTSSASGFRSSRRAFVSSIHLAKPVTSTSTSAQISVRPLLRSARSRAAREPRLRREPFKGREVAHALWHRRRGLHPSQLRDRADRTLAEEQFAKGQNNAIVCIFTMELGIDVGDLDQVIQVDAPASVASLLQRSGTGRRANTRPTALCLGGVVAPVGRAAARGGRLSKT
jgi:ATP-dependent Lhr-like helicase